MTRVTDGEPSVHPTYLRMLRGSPRRRFMRESIIPDDASIRVSSPSRTVRLTISRATTVNVPPVSSRLGADSSRSRRTDAIIYRPLGGDNLREGDTTCAHACCTPASRVIESPLKIVPYTRANWQTLRARVRNLLGARASARHPPPVDIM